MMESSSGKLPPSDAVLKLFVSAPGAKSDYSQQLRKKQKKCYLEIIYSLVKFIGLGMNVLFR
jgi:hypothetical protein